MQSLYCIMLLLFFCLGNMNNSADPIDTWDVNIEKKIKPLSKVVSITCTNSDRVVPSESNIPNEMCAK